MSISPSPDYRSRVATALGLIGIAGAAWTLLTHLSGPVTLAAFIEPPAQSYVALAAEFWSRLLPGMPRVTATDAAMLSFIAFVVMNSVNASRAAQPGQSVRPHAMLVPALIFAAIFLLAALKATANSNDGFTSSIAGRLLEPPLSAVLPAASLLLDEAYLVALSMFEFGQAPTGLLWLSVLAVVFQFLIVPLAIAATAIWFIGRVFKLPFNAAGLNARLWKILGCFALLLAANQALLWIQGQPWSPELLRPAAEQS